jgi:hypothetical protein
MELQANVIPVSTGKRIWVHRLVSCLVVLADRACWTAEQNTKYDVNHVTDYRLVCMPEHLPSL